MRTRYTLYRIVHLDVQPWGIRAMKRGSQDRAETAPAPHFPVSTNHLLKSSGPVRRDVRRSDPLRVIRCSSATTYGAQVILQRLSREEYKRLPLDERMKYLQLLTVHVGQKLDETTKLLEELKKRVGEQEPRPAAAPIRSRHGIAGLVHKFFEKSK